jgi:hypothetical protein
VRLPSLHPGQRQIKHERRRFNVIDCGRRFGKNVLLQDLAVEAALASRLPCGWAAPTYRQLLEDWAVLTDTLAPVIVRRSLQEKQLVLMGGGVLDFWSLDSADSIRGRKYGRFIVNEAGLVPNLLDIWNMVIRPTLIDMTGDAYFAGTPKGMNGFWLLYNITDPAWMRWQMPSYTNPHVPASELDALKLTMLERAFQQEIMADFLPDGGGVFRRVQEAATATHQERGIPAEYDDKGNIVKPAHQYVIGVDWGRTNDATVFKVIDVTARQECYSDRMLQTDFRTQLTRLQALAEKFNQPAIVGEYNSIGGPQVEALQNMGLSVQPFTTTNATKAAIIDRLALAFERGELQILNDPLSVGELQAYESERLPSGLIRYSAPEGMHDDHVMALALAWYGASYAAVDLIAW